VFGPGDPAAKRFAAISAGPQLETFTEEHAAPRPTSVEIFMVAAHFF